MPGQTSYFMQVTENGTYTAIVTDEYGCEFSASFTVDYASFSSLSSEALKLYPVPAKDFVILELKQSSIQTVRILDALGKEILIMNGIKKHLINLDISDLSKGTYFIRVMNDLDESTVKKLIVH